MAFEILDPVQEAVVTTIPLAPRLPTLVGKTLGIYSNEKPNADRLLAMIEEELRKRYDFEAVHGTYNLARMMDRDEWGDIERCDAVILANGDCGACSSSGIQNVIELEKRGLPTLLVSTPPFLGACQTMKSLGGMPDLQWAVVEHPICSISDDELRERAVSAVEQFESIILQGKGMPASERTEMRESVAA